MSIRKYATLAKCIRGSGIKTASEDTNGEPRLSFASDSIVQIRDGSQLIGLFDGDAHAFYLSPEGDTLQIHPDMLGGDPSKSAYIDKGGGTLMRRDTGRIYGLDKGGRPFYKDRNKPKIFLKYRPFEKTKLELPGGLTLDSHGNYGTLGVTDLGGRQFFYSMDPESSSGRMFWNPETGSLYRRKRRGGLLSFGDTYQDEEGRSMAISDAPRLRPFKTRKGYGLLDVSTGKAYGVRKDELRELSSEEAAEAIKQLRRRPLLQRIREYVIGRSK